MTVKKKIIIEGERVHNVGYRPFLLTKARRLRIPNYEAENVLEDGKEKIIVSISGEEKQVREFEGFIRKNHPPKAKTSDIREAEAPDWIMPIDEYDKVLATEQQNTIVQSGLGMLERQDQTINLQKQTLDNQEKMLDKQDQMLDKQDQMLDKQDQMLDKQEETIEVLGSKIDQGFSKMDQNFTTLRQDYGKLSDKMDDINKTLKKLTDAILKLAEKSG